MEHMKDDDYCVFAREFKAGAGFEEGEANQLIFNFKKPQSRKKTPVYG